MGNGLFASTKCRRIDLRYKISRDIFDWKAFYAFFGVQEETSKASMGANCRTLDPENLDYHIHFYWASSEEGFELYVSFHEGAFSEGEQEREPYAERLMPWLGEFMTNATAHADLHAEFSYPAVDRRSRFPLPMKFAVSGDDLEAEVTGIDATFPSSPEGISGTRIRQGKKSLSIEFTGTVRTGFAEFNIKTEVDRLSSLALRITEDISR
jgi:hypothetical protein